MTKNPLQRQGHRLTSHKSHDSPIDDDVTVPTPTKFDKHCQKHIISSGLRTCLKERKKKRTKKTRREKKESTSKKKSPGEERKKNIYFFSFLLYTPPL